MINYIFDFYEELDSNISSSYSAHLLMQLLRNAFIETMKVKMGHTKNYLDIKWSQTKCPNYDKKIWQSQM